MPEGRVDWAAELRSRLGGLQLSPAREQEVVEELSQHLDDRYEELRAAGASSVDARRAALEEVSDSGELALWMRQLAQAHTPVPVLTGQPAAGPLRGLVEDLRGAARTMRRQPIFAATIVLTLGLGIAVNTVVFTIVNAATIRPLPFDDADRLVRLRVNNVGNAQMPASDLSYLDFLDWRSARRTFVDIAAVDERGVDLSGDGRPAAALFAAHVSWNTFPLLGEGAALGRGFAESDDRPGATATVILSDDLWRTRYGADPAIVGADVRIDGVPTTVIGVMTRGFAFPDRSDLWLPLAALPEERRASRGTRGIDGIGRLRPGVSIEEATAELAGITAALAEQYPDTNRNTAPRVDTVAIAEEIIAVVTALLVAVGLVLLVACANVANLLMARAADRARDITLRVALGASRWRIIRQLLAESTLLAAAAGAVGLALSFAGLRLLTTSIPEDGRPPYFIQFTMDGTVFTYVVMLCAASALVSGLVPAWQASRTTPAAALNDTSRGSSASRQRRRWVGTFVVAQVAVALVLLSGTAVMLQNLVQLTRVDIGTDTETLVQTALSLRRPEYTAERRELFFAQLDERLAGSAGLTATLTTRPPMAGAFVQRFRLEDQRTAARNALPQVSVVGVGPRYFDVLRTPLLAGGPLAAAGLDNDSVVVNERFARTYFPGGSAVGRRILLVDPSGQPAEEGRWMTIAGIVANVRQRMLPDGGFDPVVYQSWRADPPQTLFVLARSPAGAGAVASIVGSAAQALDPDLPLRQANTVSVEMRRQFWPQQTFGSILVILAAIATALATSGLYAVTAYAVSRRTREIGVRIALGADARGVWWAVTGTTLWQLTIGLAIGIAGAAAVARLLPAMLVGAGGGTGLPTALVAVLLAAAGLAASAVPARRALRVDPVNALRAE
jgi:predicted permease